MLVTKHASLAGALRHVRRLLLILVCGLALAARMAAAQTRCSSVDFNGDVPGSPPVTGGVNQPTQLTTSTGTTVLVQASAFGIGTQPVVLTASAPSRYVDVATAFPSVATGVVRVETMVSFDRLVDGYFLQTSVSIAVGAVLTRLHSRSDGTIGDFFGTGLGSYGANQPFRVRMDIDMSAKNWSFSLDDELNGFADDPVVANLAFVNPVGVLPSVGVVNSSLNIFPVVETGAAIAYDDITVDCPDIVTSNRATTWGQVKILYR